MILPCTRIVAVPGKPGHFVAFFEDVSKTDFTLDGVPVHTVMASVPFEGEGRFKLGEGYDLVRLKDWRVAL